MVIKMLQILIILAISTCTRGWSQNTSKLIEILPFLNLSTPTGQYYEAVKSGFPTEQLKLIKNVRPTQVHLSIKYQETMTVTWSTLDLPDYSYVQYGNEEWALTKTQSGTVGQLVSRSLSKMGMQYIHEVTLRGLTPGKTYYYRCVSSQGLTRNESHFFYSETSQFRLPQNGTKWSPKLLVFGDLSLVNPVSLSSLQEEVGSHKYDAMIHCGDIAYSLNGQGGQTGNDYMTLIEPIAAQLPYQVTPGNHDRDLYHDYNDYTGRFRMPGDMGSMTYSWNLGPVHFISINTEHYFFSVHKIVEQYRWLEKDLYEANKEREIRPWIILYGHTPMYCSTNLNDSCTFLKNPLRVGCGTPNCPGLEHILYEAGVDLLIWGHEHNYEVMFPMYNSQVFNGSFKEPYTNPRAPVHVTTGAAGASSIDHFKKKKPNWSRFRDINYSYSRLEIFNETHLQFQQISATSGKVIDEFMLIQENHGDFRRVTKNVKMNIDNFLNNNNI